VHVHIDWLHLSLFRRLNVPFLTTMHGRLDQPGLGPLFRLFPDCPAVSISNAQRKPVPHASWAATVADGLPPELLRARPGGSYLAFLGRLSPEKAPDTAIRIAAAAGSELRIAAKIDRVDRAYFETTIRPLLALPGIRFIGEIDERQKS